MRVGNLLFQTTSACHSSETFVYFFWYGQPYVYLFHAKQEIKGYKKGFQL